MKSSQILLLAALSFLICSSNNLSASPMLTGAPYDLKVEYFTNPIGVETTTPQLFWKTKSDKRGAVQQAYQVLVASSKDNLERGNADCWESGKVVSDQSVFIRYDGKPLQPASRYWWKVRQWGADDVATSYSSAATWQMALPVQNWQGPWIASDLQLMDHQKLLRALTDFGKIPTTEIWKMSAACREVMAKITEAPAVYLRHEFATTSPIEHATLFVSGLGMNEVYLNGQKISDQVLSPAYTDYDKTVLYQAFDVSEKISNGENAIGVILGNGWFNLITPHCLRYYAADYISPPKLRLNLCLEYANGTSETIATSQEWKVTTKGPIRFNCVLAGETYDARMEMAGWTKPGFDDSSWTTATLTDAPKGQLKSRLEPPVRVITTSTAIAVKQVNNAWQFDLGEESAGWSRVRLKGKPGQKITISYPGSGSHTFGRYQTCEYICKGSDWEDYAPRFSYGGYRYINVQGLDYQPEPSDLVGEVVNSDMEHVGEFSCSDERFNKLQEILLRTFRNYTIHIPADPTREKAGWTEDVHSNFFEHAWNMMVAPTYSNWQRDFIDAVQADGYVPPVVPSRFDGPDINGPWWGGVVIYAPWYLYQFYGDVGILAESYPAMQRQYAYLKSIAKDDIVEWGLGDWLAITPGTTPVPQTSTAAYAWFAEILSQTAGILNKETEASAYRIDAERIKEAYNRKFLNTESGVYAQGSQTSQLISLYLNLVPEELKPKVMQQLLAKIREDKTHLTSGFVGTPMLLTGLTELGQADTAWTIATQTTYPGFIDAILNRGNTVFKEDWTGGQVQMPNLQGPIGTWFYESLAGIRRDPQFPGMKRLRLMPETSNTLTWVKAYHDNLYGRVESHWLKDGTNFKWTVVIPANTSAEVKIPAKAISLVTESGQTIEAAPGITHVRIIPGFITATVGSGTYSFLSTTAFDEKPSDK